MSPYVMAGSCNYVTLCGGWLMLLCHPMWWLAHTCVAMLLCPGAGTVLEALTAGQRLLVVVNDELMNNHQVELAVMLHRLHHLHYCTVE